MPSTKPMPSAKELAAAKRRKHCHREGSPGEHRRTTARPVHRRRGTPRCHRSRSPDRTRGTGRMAQPRRVRPPPWLRLSSGRRLREALLIGFKVRMADLLQRHGHSPRRCRHAGAGSRRASAVDAAGSALGFEGVHGGRGLRASGSIRSTHDSQDSKGGSAMTIGTVRTSRHDIRGLPLDGRPSSSSPTWR